MSSIDELSEFVREGLSAGHSPDELAKALGQAGWAEREVATAIDAWVPSPAGMPPVPRPRPYVSAREAVIYGLLFLILVCICWHVVSLGFKIIDWFISDPDDSYYSYYGMRWNIAVLIPTVPLFLWLNRKVVQNTSLDPGQRRSLVRKWFAAVTMMLAVLTLLGDLIATIYAVLSGELTLQFILNALLIAVVGGLALAYYRDELDER